MICLISAGVNFEVQKRGARSRTDIGHGSLDPDFELSHVPCPLQSQNPPTFLFCAPAGWHRGALGSVTAREEAQPSTKDLGNSEITRNMTLMDFLFISDSS